MVWYGGTALLRYKCSDSTLGLTLNNHTSMANKGFIGILKKTTATAMDMRNTTTVFFFTVGPRLWMSGVLGLQAQLQGSTLPRDRHADSESCFFIRLKKRKTSFFPWAGRQEYLEARDTG